MKEEWIHITFGVGNYESEPEFDYFTTESEEEYDAEMEKRERNLEVTMAIKRKDIIKFLKSLPDFLESYGQLYNSQN
jgi:hypothetical protein